MTSMDYEMYSIILRVPLIFQLNDRNTSTEDLEIIMKLASQLFNREKKTYAEIVKIHQTIC